MPKVDETKPTGEPVTFYLERDPHMDRTKRYLHRFDYNGHVYEVEFGKRNTLPKEVAQYLKNLGATPTRVIDVDRYDPDRGGVARPQEAFEQPVVKEEVNARFGIDFI